MKIKEIMNGEDVCNYYIDVTDIVKEVFGNIVKEAWSCVFTAFDKCTMEDGIDFAKGAGNRFIENFNKKHRLSTDMLYIQFTNGKCVYFENTEYGFAKNKELLSE